MAEAKNENTFIGYKINSVKYENLDKMMISKRAPDSFNLNMKAEHDYSDDDPVNIMEKKKE
jgi:hypothetical protein